MARVSSGSSGRGPILEAGITSRWSLWAAPGLICTVEVHSCTRVMSWRRYLDEHLCFSCSDPSGLRKIVRVSCARSYIKNWPDNLCGNVTVAHEPAPEAEKPGAAPGGVPTGICRIAAAQKCTTNEPLSIPTRGPSGGLHVADAVALRGVNSASSADAMRCTRATASARRCRCPCSVAACRSAICARARAPSAAGQCCHRGLGLHVRTPAAQLSSQRQHMLQRTPPALAAHRASAQAPCSARLLHTARSAELHVAAACAHNADRAPRGHAPAPRRRASPRWPAGLPARRCAQRAPRPRPTVRRQAPRGRPAAPRPGRSRRRQCRRPRRSRARRRRPSAPARPAPRSRRPPRSAPPARASARAAAA